MDVSAWVARLPDEELRTFSGHVVAALGVVDVDVLAACVSRGDRVVMLVVTNVGLVRASSDLEPARAFDVVVSLVPWSRLDGVEFELTTDWDEQEFGSVVVSFGSYGDVRLPGSSKAEHLSGDEVAVVRECMSRGPGVR